MQLRTRKHFSVPAAPALALLALGLAGAPAAFSQSAAAPHAQQPAQAPAAASQLPPAPSADANPFPPVNPRNFTASTPTKETVNGFLRSSWGYDSNRIWQVQAILKTPVDGLSKVIVLVAEKGGEKRQAAQLTFYVLPGGKYLISNEVLPFGDKPFAGNRELLKTEATGPSKGAPGKDLEFVEFSDFECPHCREAEPIVSKLLADYPNAHYVYQNFPLVEIHSEAFKAAAYGVCVAKTSGNSVFFKYADAVFATQGGLTPTESEETLKAAVTKAGGDPAKVSACAALPATKDAVNHSIALGEKLGVNSTPTIFVNGRGLPLTGIPYSTLTKIIDFQAAEDGILLPPKPPRLEQGPAK